MTPEQHARGAELLKQMDTENKRLHRLAELTDALKDKPVTIGAGCHRVMLNFEIASMALILQTSKTQDALALLQQEFDNL